jgi:hypothetical protein
MQNNNDIITPALKRLEDLAVLLYNKIDYDSVEVVCSIIQDIYINLNKADEAKRIDKIIKKLHIIKNYMETNRDIFARAANETKPVENKDAQEEQKKE